MAASARRDGFGVRQHHHASVQNVECKPILAADQGADLALENGDFLGAIEALHAEGEASLIGTLSAPGLLVRAQPCTTAPSMIPVTVFMGMAVIMGMRVSAAAAGIFRHVRLHLRQASV